MVDLDPQTNATVSLIDQFTWQSRHAAGQTLYHLFYDVLNGRSTFDINQAVMKDVGGVSGLDLLPSSLELVEIQDEIPDMDNKAYVSHVDVLGNAITEVEGSYDFIIIDCPPNLGAITLNGINISDYYVVSTVPGILSKIGINLILNRIENFKRRKRTCKIELAGVVFTKVDYRTNLHLSTMQELRGRSDLGGHVFSKELPRRISIAEAPVDSMPFITSPADMANIKRKDVESFGRVLKRLGQFLEDHPERLLDLLASSQRERHESRDEVNAEDAKHLGLHDLPIFEMAKSKSREELLALLCRYNVDQLRYLIRRFGALKSKSPQVLAEHIADQAMKRAVDVFTSHE